MNYEEAVEYIHSTRKLGWKLGLDNMNALLGLLGDPHRKLKYVHVAGTNGKGSTVSYISTILMEAGYKVGIFTSPYIQRFTERIKIGREEISGEDLGKYTARVKEKIEEMVRDGKSHPTEFEIVTAIAFLYYADNSCDIVVLEVGLGGRYDSTNVISTPEAAVIVTINYDHMAILGDTLPQIAYEKAGIIKENGDVVLYPQLPEVEQVFAGICREKHARLHKVDFSGVSEKGFSIEGQTFDYNKYKGLRITLLGEHQVRNAVVALETVEILNKKGFKIDEDAVRKGLERTRWPGRFEILNRKPLLLIDGAHNPECAQALYRALTRYFPGRKISFIFGMMRDKDIRPVMEIISPIARRFVTVTPDDPRAATAEELAMMLRDYCNEVHVGDTIENAVRKSMELATEEDIICAFGSLYYIGRIRSMFI